MPIEIDKVVYLTTKEACEVLRVSSMTIKAMVDDNLLSRYKRRGLGNVVLYKEEDINNLYRVYKVEPKNG